jgi:hypothetical protein
MTIQISADILYFFFSSFLSFVVYLSFSSFLSFVVYLSFSSFLSFVVYLSFSSFLSFVAYLSFSSFLFFYCLFVFLFLSFFRCLFVFLFFSFLLLYIFSSLNLEIFISISLIETCKSFLFSFYLFFFSEKSWFLTKAVLLHVRMCSSILTCVTLTYSYLRVNSTRIKKPIFYEKPI